MNRRKILTWLKPLRVPESSGKWRPARKSSVVYIYLEFWKGWLSSQIPFAVKLCFTSLQTVNADPHMFELFILFEIYKRPSYLELEHSKVDDEWWFEWLEYVKIFSTSSKIYQDNFTLQRDVPIICRDIKMLMSSLYWLSTGRGLYELQGLVWSWAGCGGHVRFQVWMRGTQWTQWAGRGWLWN